MIKSSKLCVTSDFVQDSHKYHSCFNSNQVNGMIYRSFKLQIFFLWFDFYVLEDPIYLMWIS